jgi:hypothetical protein
MEHESCSWHASHESRSEWREWAFHRLFGWLLSGRCKDEGGDRPLKNEMLLCLDHGTKSGYAFTASRFDTPAKLEDIWSLVASSIKDQVEDRTEAEVLKQFEETVECRDGRYHVSYPLKDKVVKLPYNCEVAHPEVALSSHCTPEVTKSPYCIPEDAKSPYGIAEVAQSSHCIPEVAKSPYCIPEVAQSSHCMNEVVQPSLCISEVEEPTRYTNEVVQYSRCYTNNAQYSELSGRWMKCQGRMDQLWKISTTEHLPRNRYETCLKEPKVTEHSSAKVRHVVLLKDCLPRGQWRIGKVCAACSQQQR